MAVLVLGTNTFITIGRRRRQGCRGGGLAVFRAGQRVRTVCWSTVSMISAYALS